MSFLLQDTNGQRWQVSVNDAGALTTLAVASGTVSSIYLNDPGLSTSWQLGVNIYGQITSTAVSFSAGYPTSITMASASGYQFLLKISSGGILQLLSSFALPTSRRLSIAMIAKLQTSPGPSSSSWAPVIFVAAQCISQMVRVWTGIGTIVWGGFTWQGIGGLVAIEFPQESGDVQADNFRVSLSGIDPNQIELALNECRQGNPVQVWLGAMADDGSIIPDPVLAAAGRMDIPVIEDGAQSSTISLTCESLTIDLKTPRLRTYTDYDQRLDYPEDAGFAFVAGIQTFNRRW